jgi:hypothetical protein
MYLLLLDSAGTMSELTVTQTVDTCITVSDTEFCGADLPECDGNEESGTPQSTMCTVYNANWKELVGNPPITFMSVTASFNDVCPAGQRGPTHVVSFNMAASGDLSDYTTGVRDEIATAVAARLSGVSSTDVRVTVTAGSVNIDIEIDASDESAAETISDTVTTEITSSSTTATSFLQTVSALSTVSVSDVTSPQVRVASRGLDAGGVFGIILGIMCVIGLVLAPVIYRRIKKDESKVVPEEGPVPTPPA